MPVTARLSKKFYDTLGEDIAQELVDWFNQVDATYRGDLKELNDLNFARFDAKVEQRLTELEARLGQRMVDLEARVEKRIVKLEAWVEQRIARLEASNERRLGELEAKLGSRMDSLERRTESLEKQVDRRFSEAALVQKSEIEALRASLIKWMFGFWAPTALTLVALIIATLR